MLLVKGHQDFSELKVPSWFRNLENALTHLVFRIRMASNILCGQKLSYSNNSLVRTRRQPQFGRACVNFLMLSTDRGSFVQNLIKSPLTLQPNSRVFVLLLTRHL